MYESKNDELYHYGVPGMKWGVRRYQNYDGTPILKKGTVVKRVSLTKEDPTYDNKTYVSINQQDHNKWVEYMGNGYLKRGRVTYEQSYKTTKDIKILSKEEQGKRYTEMLKDTPFWNQAFMDTVRANDMLRLSKSDDPAENISRNIAAQTATGKKFVDRILKDGYDAIVDVHGQNVSKDPLIILNPDSNLSKTGEADFTKPVKEYIRRRRM